MAAGVVAASVSGGIIGASLASDDPGQPERPAAGPTTSTGVAAPTSAAATPVAITPEATAAEATDGTGESPTPDLSPWPGEPAGEILVSDTDFVIGWEHSDFETNDLDGDADHDVAGAQQGMHAINGTVLFPWNGPSAPDLRGCRSLPENDRVMLIPAAQFEETAYFCIRTTAGRYGYLATDEMSGDPPDYVYYYVVWKKPGDP